MPEPNPYASDGTIARGVSWLYDGFAVAVRQNDFYFDHRVALIPPPLIRVAAADHCFAAAYRGECPGVNPDELMRWHVERLADFECRAVESVLADIEWTRQALREAPELVLEVTPGGHCGDGRRCDCREGCYRYGGSTARGSGDCFCDCDGCMQGDYYVTARDMRGRAVPYIEEAAALEGVAYVATTIDGDRRKTFLGCATRHKIEAFRSWAQSQGLVDVYADPVRGIAGAYEFAPSEANA